MSFHPLSPGISQSLLGVGANPDLLDSSRYINRDYIDRSHYLSEGKVPSGYTKLILTVIISAIVFVTIVAIYDVLRNAINNKYAKIALEDPAAQNTQESINSTEIANQQALISSIVFAILCILSAIVLVYIIVQYLKSI